MFEEVRIDGSEAVVHKRVASLLLKVRGSMDPQPSYGDSKKDGQPKTLDVRVNQYFTFY